MLAGSPGKVKGLMDLYCHRVVEIEFAAGRIAQRSRSDVESLASNGPCHKSIPSSRYQVVVVLYIYTTVVLDNVSVCKVQMI